jgi:hypothetical protein
MHPPARVRKLIVLSLVALSWGCARNDSRITAHVKNRIARDP